MKVKRMLALLLATLTLASLFAVAAFATPSKPYGNYDVTISDGLFKDTATAFISRCSCIPVDNYLKASIQVQYKEDGGYHWLPSETSVYFQEETNKDSASVSVTQKNIVYADGMLRARCSSGITLSYPKTVTNN